MLDITICLPSIRTENLIKFYNSLVESIGQYTFELIIISPIDLSNEIKQLNHVKVIVDQGCPTRCVQIGANEGCGKLFNFGTDDGVFVKNALGESISHYNQNCSVKDVVITKYTEGVGAPASSPIHESDAYWGVNYHPSLHLDGINRQHKWGIPLMDLGYFKEAGGLDCVFEHCNYSLHDFCYRLQNNGSIFYLTKNCVMNCDWNPKGSSECLNRTNATDYIKFKEIYQNPTSRFKIDFDNWKNSPNPWVRFQ